MKFHYKAKLQVVLNLIVLKNALQSMCLDVFLDLEELLDLKELEITQT